ncbi:uncharacterized protein LOC123525206 [Mercenaria mercenaria]|uniref:uncharacterized protein LOC123525206 n=1 Tax=Mercenaria mercenaria TaxID=6596 RepID=UPI00234FA5E6|nr:uncharacterized protein LOC123525206 [Mercenaria mercenaria]XP_053394057.1 uncharacterized protein LOC123525206 [Mercenaria mercenaria]
MRMLSRMRGLYLIPSVSKLNGLTGSLYRNGLYNGYQHLHSMSRTGSGDHTVRCTIPKEIKPLNCYKHVRFYSDDRKQTALSVIKDLKHLKSSPFPALVIGGSGLIPFIAAPLYMGMTGSFIASLAYSQVAYGAVILSFVGAVRWGMALSEDGIVRPNWVNLGYSVTPSLIAWVALMMPTTLALSTLILGLGGAAYMDIMLYGYPSWFKAMRFLLTLTAILSLWTTLVFKYILSDTAKKRRAEAKKVEKYKQTKDDIEKAVTQAVSEIDPVADLVLSESKQADSKPHTTTNKTMGKTGQVNPEIAVMQAVSEIDPVADLVLVGNKEVDLSQKADAVTGKDIKGETGNSERAVMQAVSEVDPVADLILVGSKEPGPKP